MAIAAPASAAIIIVDHNLAGSLDTILLDAADDGSDNVVLGLSNSGWTVKFTSNVDIIATTGGQAWLQGTNADMNFLDISTPGATFTDLELNINGPPQATWDIQLTGYNAAGVQFTQYFSALPNGTISGGPFPTPAIFTDQSGNEFFNFRATGGDVFTHASYQVSDPTPLGQVRIGGVAAVVPEPATWAMMIVGFGGLGALLRRRRAQLALA
jgi:hypothetical protein